MNPTNDPALRSFIPVPAESHFPIQNLPYGVFRRRAAAEAHIGVAIGNMVLDLAVLAGHKLLSSTVLKWGEVFRDSTLNAFVALGRPAWQEARSIISRL